MRRAVESLLPEGAPTLPEVATHLELAPRTLQRRLKDEGTSFAAMLEDTRRALARHYLRDTDLGLVDVSYLLGFAHPNSFRRAFRRWSGTTPAAYRADARERPAGTATPDV